MNYFNSTLVRLKAYVPCYSFVPQNDFNSTLVRLKDQLLYGDGTGINYFNSTLVRLKEDAGNGIRIENAEFQFHIGTIKSRSTTQKNTLIFNNINVTKIIFLMKKVVEHPESIFHGCSTICYKPFIFSMSKNLPEKFSSCLKQYYPILRYIDNETITERCPVSVVHGQQSLSQAIFPAAS